MAIKLIVGTDEYLVSNHAHAAVNALCPETEQALGLETVDGAVKTISDALTALKTCLGALRMVGLFGGQKTVWLRDATLFKDATISKNKEVKEMLVQLAAEMRQGLPEGHHLVISAAGLDKRSAFYKACVELADIESYDLPEQDYKKLPVVKQRAALLFKEGGCQISAATLDFFLEKVGTDTRAVMSEAEKLMIYVGDQADISPKDVRAITSSSAEAITWDFTDALGTRKLEDALRILRQLLFQGESEVGIIFAMENLFNSLTQFRAFLDQDWLRLGGGYGAASVKWSSREGLDNYCNQLPTDPRKMHWFRVSKVGQQAKNYTAKELRRCQSYLLETHEQLVSSGVTKEIILEMLVIKLIAKK